MLHELWCRTVAACNWRLNWQAAAAATTARVPQYQRLIAFNGTPAASDWSDTACNLLLPAPGVRLQVCACAVAVACSLLLGWV
jgi:hypothetical protein